MSRICVKALGRDHDEKVLREHFSQYGATVTDAKVARHPDGVSRCFGFVGFKNEKDAKTAVKHFNNTFLDTKKIVVEIAKPVGDDALPRPWSKYSKGSSAYQRLHPDEAGDINDKNKNHQNNNEPSDPNVSNALKDLQILKDIKQGKSEHLHEFLSAAKGRKGTKLWANDDGTGDLGKVKVGKTAVQSKKPGGEGVFLTRTHVTFEEEEEDDDNDDDAKDESDMEYEDVPKDTKNYEDEETSKNQRSSNQNSVAFNDDMGDVDYLKSKVAASFSDDEEDNDEENEDDGDNEDDDIEDDGDGDGSSSNDNDKDHIGGNDDDDDDSNQDSEKEKKKKKKKKNSAEDSSNTDDIDDIFANKKKEDDKKKEDKNDDAEDDMADAGETGRLFLRNLSYTCDESDLRKLFSEYGDLTEVHICLDRQTKQPTGMGFVLFMMPECAVRAMAALDAKIFQGRLLHVLPAKSLQGHQAQQFKITAASSFKKKKEAEMKSKAMNAANWNTLFMRPDAVASAVAENIGVEKASLLDPEAESSMAVRLALGETHIIAETKTYLEKQGIDLSAFEGSKGRTKAGGRSQVVIIVKNIPNTTEEAHIRNLFGKFGDLGRVVIPPARTIAVVEFLAADDAKRAFRSLAYTKFKEVPLYLEWAPAGAFRSGPTPPKMDKDAKNNENRLPKKETEKESEAHATTTTDIATTANTTNTTTNTNTTTTTSPLGATLFVKNLNFDTTEEKLKEHCIKSGRVRSVAIIRKKDKKKGMISLGYGFIEFESAKEAERALRKLHGSTLEGHQLELKVSNRGRNEEHEEAGPSGAQIKAKTTKITVRNVPFEATRQELRELFGAFGQINSVRLPKKFDGSHRGFAFVDFITKEEAAAAFKALQNTHLYGRHLVLEWANEDSSLEAIREKTAKYYHQLQESSAASTKKRKVETDLKEKEEEEESDDENDLMHDNEISIFAQKKGRHK